VLLLICISALLWRGLLSAELITPTAFTDGVMQYTENGEWVSDRPGYTDMQGYFVVR